jgi:hypothetical protein
MTVPDRKTVTFAVLIVGGAALVLWLMMQNRPERGAYADGDTSTDEPRVTVAALARLVADDRETANRWFGGKAVRVSGSVCLVSKVADEGGTFLVVGLSPVAYQESATVFGYLSDPKDVEGLRLHEPAELRGTLDPATPGPKGFVTLKNATVVRPWARGRSLR